MEPHYFNIIDLIPQRQPMQMIDRLESVTEKSGKGSFTIRDDNMFLENGRLSESAMVEFIAQTAAAFTGYNHKVNQAPVREGYIGAIKNLVIYDLPSPGEQIFSDIEIVNEIVGFTIITGKVFSGDKLLCECEMRILEGR
jgi:predicted hotdog family 3-hydroxylacyl-ACP dehydratase